MDTQRTQTLTDRCEQVLREKISRAVKESDRPWLEIKAGELEKDLSWKNRMPMVCAAMRKVQQDCDELVYEPPKTKGSNLRIRYSLRDRRPGSAAVPTTSTGSGDDNRELRIGSELPLPRTTSNGEGDSSHPPPLESDLTRIGNELAEDDSEGDEFEPDDADGARERRLRSVALRRGQPKFRRALLKAYGSRCAISACQVDAVLEAAHILPYSEGGPNRIDNGVLLRADLHTLMDLELLMLELDDAGVLRARIAEALQGTSYDEYDGVELAVPTATTHQPSAAFIRRRWPVES